MDKHHPYIAIIEDYYKTSKGNYLCREKGNDLSTHPYDWPIFIPEEFTKEISKLPIYGILIKDKNQAFVNGERITCRVLSYDHKKLQDILDRPIKDKEDCRNEILEFLRKNNK